LNSDTVFAGQQGLFLGFDPGGYRRFGVAAIADESVSFGTVSSIREALEWSMMASTGRVPVAAGVDTILHWATGTSGMREADKHLRKTYPEVSGSVMAPNSLYGAMTIGGVGLGIKLREVWPNVLLNETHPKVIFHALSGLPYPRGDMSPARQWLAETSALKILGTSLSEDEFDAILSAWATREALCNHWTDIAARNSEHIHPISEVTYYWPTKL
jgi:hypothetical protein